MADSGASQPVMDLAPLGDAEPPPFTAIAAEHDVSDGGVFVRQARADAAPVIKESACAALEALRWSW